MRHHPGGSQRHLLAEADAGAASLELSMLAPALLLLIFFVIQVGLWGYGRAVALQAAREGVSQMRILPDAQSTAAAQATIEDGVQRYAATLGNSSLIDPQVTSREYTDERGTTRVEFTVSGAVISLVPGITFTTTQSATGAVESFRDPT